MLYGIKIPDQASFKCLRTDNKPRDIKREIADITNPGKVILDDTEITKADVIRQKDLIK